MVKKPGGKPSGAKTAYVCFLQVCREEHQKRCPNQPIVLKDFSKSCSEKWKGLSDKDKKKFQDMAARDKIRYQKEMETYVPPPGEKRKRKYKDPNKPKRNLSAFFFFCNEKRPDIQRAHPDWKVGDVAKELGKLWEKCSDRERYEKMAARDKERYEREMEVYRRGGAVGSSKKSKAPPAPEPDDDDEDEEDYDDDDDDDDYDDQ